MINIMCLHCVKVRHLSIDYYSPVDKEQLRIHIYVVIRSLTTLTVSRLNKETFLFQIYFNCRSLIVP